MQLTTEDKLLLAVVSIEPSEVELQYIDSLLPLIQRWDYAMRLLTQHGSAPLLYVKLPHLQHAHCIPLHWTSHLQQVYYKSLSRGMLLYRVFVEVVQELQKHNIDMIVLKGAYLSECVYPDIALRQFTDIDLLVHERDGLRCLELLQNTGFVPWASQGISAFVDAQSDFAHYRPLQKGDVSVEIHIKLHTRSKKYKLSVPHMWERSVPCVIQGLQVRTLCTEDLLMYLCVHALIHFQKGDLNLKSMNDLVIILHTLPDTFDWKKFSSLCKLYACENSVRTVFQLLSHYYRAPLPTDVAFVFEHQVSDATLMQFQKYLTGQIDKQKSNPSASSTSTHINNLRNIKNPRLVMQYLFEIIFPSKAFMIEKYGLHSGSELPKRHVNIQKSTCWWLWYPYRWFTGLRALFMLRK